MKNHSSLIAVWLRAAYHERLTDSPRNSVGCTEGTLTTQCVLKRLCFA